ncbi:MAG TPA: ATP-binding domain-containing protein [Actinomycetes bacterium]|nr:ATP-binding domain-containing protein [Actinomycetes bacterium]
MSQTDVDFEQRYVDGLYARLDFLQERAEAELVRVRKAGATGTPQARSERDAFATLYEDRIVQLRGVEDRLCFGRIDVSDGSTRYVGRVGLFDDEQTQLLVDWRAPAARDFYQATAANPGDVVRRRHLQTRGREVTAVYDDVLRADENDVNGVAADDGTLVADGVLFAALNAARTGRMGDIVATIQAEQDQIIRAPLAGVVVVQGGPGTGKTAVALHRAAYLLYTHRDRLASRGVLLVGPSPVFLRYISSVLPSLGETGVVTVTPSGLYPGIDVTAAEAPDAERLKGSSEMAQVVSTAIRLRQRAPEGTRTFSVEGATIRVRRKAFLSAIESARRTEKPHNLARHTFVRIMLDHMASLIEQATGRSLAAHDRADIRDTLRESADVRRELNLAWPPLDPEGLLRQLFASPERVYAATPGWTNDQRVLLLRAPQAGWTLSDVPLLDEAAELIGFDDTHERARAQLEAAGRAEAVEYAREVLRGVGGVTSEMLNADDVLSADDLASRFTERVDARSVADSASGDRAWSYGHIIVDEAQELSAMMWRLLRRRCPSGSMTLVGDVAQTGSSAGANTWDQTLNPIFGRGWTNYELSVNYRTPAEVMECADAMLRGSGVQNSPPVSVRSVVDSVSFVRTEPDDLDAITKSVGLELDRVGGGRLAVVVPVQLKPAVEERVSALLNGDRTDIDAAAAVLTATEVKGLEFDSVIVVEPSEILSAPGRGPHHLYVALTRATQRLVVVHGRDLPPGMDSHSSLEP